MKGFRQITQHQQLKLMMSKRAAGYAPVQSKSPSDDDNIAARKLTTQFRLFLVFVAVFVLVTTNVIILTSTGGILAVEAPAHHSHQNQSAKQPPALEPPKPGTLATVNAKMTRLDIPITSLILDSAEFSMIGQSLGDWALQDQTITEESLLWVKPPTKGPLPELHESEMAAHPYGPSQDSHNATLYWWSITKHDPKHFHEVGTMQHFDGRFAKEPTSAIHPVKAQKLKSESLIDLLRAYSTFIDTHNITSWIAHGTLLSWYWGQNLFPWDEDMDFQVPLQQLLKRMVPLNNTLFENKYLLDVNPNVLYRGHQRENVIDARFIDTTDGRYLDITALAYFPSEGLLKCKSPHKMRVSDVLKLHRTRIAGVDVWRPEGAAWMLGREYYERGLTATRHLGYVFQDGVWKGPPPKRPKYEAHKFRNGVKF